MQSSSSSNTNRKGVVLTVDDKLKVCEMILKKCHNYKNLEKEMFDMLNEQDMPL